MAENHDSEELREGSAAAEDGNSNNSIPVEPTLDSAGNDRLEGSQPRQDESNDGKVTEDGGREDMFVDCSEEIETSETRTNSEEKDEVQDSHVEHWSNQTQVEDSVAEIARLHNKLEETVSEKQSFTQKYEEEKATLKRELAHLHYQLKALNDQGSLLDKADVALPDHHCIPELGDRDEKDLASDSSLHEMVTECSKFLNSAMGLYSQAENSIKELHASLQMKDSEIEDLNSKITEFTMSREVIVSYLDSMEEAGSRTSEVQLEKDHMIEEIVNRILTSLPVTVCQEGGFLGDSTTEKFSHIERSILLLAEKYNQFISEIDKLKLCLTDITPDIYMEDELGIFSNAGDKLLELKRKELHLEEKLSHFENENRELVEQLDKNKAVIESAHAEIGNLNTEIAQEKTRYANTKEKLSLAVTKGKALVQQRDSLKRALADKTRELEKCLIELREKSSALGSAEQSKDLLLKSESLALHLQESLAKKDSMLQKCGEILSQAAETEEIQPFDLIEKLRRITDEMNALKGLTIEFQKLSDALSPISFPENMSSNDMETRVNWLVESFSIAKEEAVMLQEEIVETREASSKEIDRLVQSVLAETQEKNYLQEELEDLRCKYEGVVEKEHLVSSERDQIVSMLLEASGMTNTLEKVNISQHDIARIIAKIKEEAEASVESSYRQAEILERLQSLLYIRAQDVTLYEHLLEEGVLSRAEMNQISEKLSVVNQELRTLKDEKVSLEKELVRSEEKAALIREKLSMAVKKGKGLVQERENLRRVLDEKNTEIKRLTSELQDQVYACNDCRDQITKLVADMDCIRMLETDLVATKEQRNQLEQLLVESNNMLQKVIESIDSIDLPSDLVFKEPVEKVKWLSGYLSECQNAQQELEKLKEESNSFTSKLVEAETSMKSLEDALLDAQNSISQILEEKRELEVAKIQTEEELQKSLAEVTSQKSKFAEVSATIKSFEDALTVAEDNISDLANAKEDALISRAAIEMELKKLKEENSIHVSRLAEAESTIKSLKDAFSQAQKNLSLLAEENNMTLIGRSDLEDNMKRLKVEADSQASKLADAAMTIKSLEDARLNAENKIVDLVKENQNAEHAISVLTSKLQACLQELDGSRGSITNMSMELSGYLTSIQMILRDDILLSLLKQSFEKKIESLHDMDVILKEMRVCFFDMIGSDLLQNQPVEDDYSVSTLLPDGLDNVTEMEMINGWVNVVDNENIVLHFEKTLEGLHLRDKTLAEKFGSCSGYLDDFILVLLKRLRVAKDGVIVARELLTSLKQRVNDIEMDRQAQENAVSMLEIDIAILLSACSKATDELEVEVQNNLSELSSVSVLENYYSSSVELGASGGDALIDHNLKIEGNKYVQTAEKLLLATRHSQNLSKDFRGMKNMMVSTVGGLQNELRETKTTCENLLEQRDVNQKKISKLETDLEAAENLCREMKLKVEDHEDREARLKEREAELLAAHSTSLRKVHEVQEFPLSASQIKSLFDQISAIDISFPESEVENLETKNSADEQKFFYIIDNFKGLKDRIDSESQEKERLQSMLEKQVIAIEHLKEEVKVHVREKQESERMKNELALGLESIIQKLGGDKLVGDEKVAHVTGLLSVLDMMVMATKMESENLKSKTDELSTKLLSSQKVVEELSSKVKLLEGSSHGGVTFPETIKEKGISEQSSSNSHPEISEIQDLGTVGQNVAVSSIPSAAHVRTLRKGSSDHLAVSIDPESERFLNNGQADEDKGHVFKSLNTSGLIPRQGKTIADRIDGIWVSGGRALMSHPRARIGLIAYWLFLHIWVLGSIL